ncbi:MAG: hypothetical protein AB8G99_05250 [Planctomycetaceae bacterium]
MNRAIRLLALSTLFYCGCQMSPLQLDGFMPAPTRLDDVKAGERYVFLIEPDESGASFKYAGEVLEVNEREIALQNATVDVHLESSRSMFRKLFGDKEPVASKLSKKKLIVEKHRVQTVLPESSGQPSQ